MGTLKHWHCGECHSEFDAFCPICANCAGIAWELSEETELNDDEIISIDEMLEEIENKEDENNNEWEV